MKYILFFIILTNLSCSNSKLYSLGEEEAIKVCKELNIYFPHGYLRNKTKEQYLKEMKFLVDEKLPKHFQYKGNDLNLFKQGFLNQMLRYHKLVKERTFEEANDYLKQRDELLKSFKNGREPDINGTLKIFL